MIDHLNNIITIVFSNIYIHGQNSVLSSDEEELGYLNGVVMIALIV